MKTIPENASNSQARRDPQPYGCKVFTDFDRQKTFVELHYKRVGVSRQLALSLPEQVILAVSGQGMVITDKVQMDLHILGAEGKPANSKTQYNCFLTVPVRPQTEDPASDRDWAQQLQQRYQPGPKS